MQEAPDSSQGGHIHRVTVRLPPFWPDRPRLWFAQAEAQFNLASVPSETTKFNYVVSQLEYRHAAEVEDIIILPPANEPYTTLKAELVRRLSSSRDQSVRQLLTQEEIGDRKPFQFLRHLKSLAPDVPDDILRSTWSSRLPPHIQTILAGQAEGNLDAASQLADQIAEVAPLPTTAAIAQAPDTVGLLQKVEDLSRQVAALTSSRTRQHSHSRDRRKANDVLPSAPRSADTVGTSGNSGTRHEGVLHRAPSASSKTATTFVNGGRLLFQNLRPPIHHRTRHNKATRSFTTYHINNRSRANHGASPDNRLHSADSLACSHTGPLRACPDIRLPRVDSLAHSLAGPPRNSGQPDAQDASPAASPVHSAHLRRPSTQAH
jgi:hypothetical protein